MDIVEYVNQNWDTLPKSCFNADQCVIVRCDHDSDEGYGHHCYSGVGVDKDGYVVWCYSSGCSCSGSCGQDHRDSTKVLDADIDLSSINPETLDFNALAVSFSDYE